MTEQTIADAAKGEFNGVDFDQPAQNGKCPGVGKTVDAELEGGGDS